MSPLQPPARSIWQPQTCPWGLQAAPFLPDRRGWGESQQGEGNPFTQLPNSPPTPWTFLFPPLLTVLAFPYSFDLMIILGLKTTKFPPGTPIWGGLCFFLTIPQYPTCSSISHAANF